MFKKYFVGEQEFVYFAHVIHSLILRVVWIRTLKTKFGQTESTRPFFRCYVEIVAHCAFWNEILLVVSASLLICLPSQQEGTERRHRYNRVQALLVQSDDNDDFW